MMDSVHVDWSEGLIREMRNLLSVEFGAGASSAYGLDRWSIAGAMLELDLMMTQCVEGAFRGEVEQTVIAQLDALQWAAIAAGLAVRTPRPIDDDANA